MIAWSRSPYGWDQELQLQALRERFPHWGFLVIRGHWVAVRGKTVTISAPSAADLRAYLDPMPDRDQG